MTFTLDVLQICSTSAAVIALMVLIMQTRDGTRQTSAVRGEMLIMQNTWLAQAYIDHRTRFFQNNPELLDWYFSSRGYRSTTAFENLQRLYALTTLDLHEGIHLQHLGGTISKEIWSAWQEVLATDLRVPVYRDVWANGAKFYEASFAKAVDSHFLRHDQEARAGRAPGTSDG